MTTKQFFNKWDIDITSSTHYKRRFPQFVENNQMDWDALDKHLSYMRSIKEKALDILSELRAKDLEFFFEGKNVAARSHHLMNRMFNVSSHAIIRKETYEKCLIIIEKFGNKKGEE